MITVVASFLAKGTGPRQLRSALRAKTKPLGALLRSIEALKAVRAEASPNVLGGDLIALLSNRMRALLQVNEQPPDGTEVISTRESKFPDQNDFVHSPKSEFSPDSEAEEASANGFAALERALQRHASFPAPPNSRDSSSLLDPFAPRQSLAVSQPGWEPARVLPDNGRNSFPSGGSEAPTRGQNKEAARSLLAEKPREYWELSQTQPTSAKASDHVVAASSRSESPAATQPQRPAMASPQPWPDATARQLARKVRSSGADLSSTRASQTINSGSPDKVEIQNVFNIEVKPSGVGAADSSDDLSERISDLLRQQALQHGIDVT
jgi:hypothetical protein